MPGSYRHIQEYEKDILKLKEQGLTQQKIANRLGFTKVIDEYIPFYNYERIQL